MMDTAKTTMRPLKLSLLNSARRLVKILELDAPDLVIASEIGLLYRRGLAGLGHELLRSTFGSFIDLTRHHAGVCVLCDSKTSISNGDGYYCDECAKAIEDETTGDYGDYIDTLQFPSTN